jgi:hypothetical protein
VPSGVEAAGPLGGVGPGWLLFGAVAPHGVCVEVEEKQEASVVRML